MRFRLCVLDILCEYTLKDIMFEHAIVVCLALVVCYFVCCAMLCYVVMCYAAMCSVRSAIVIKLLLLTHLGCIYVTNMS